MMSGVLSVASSQPLNCESIVWVKVDSMDEEMRGGDLTAEEVGELPEIMTIPVGARILYTSATGTYDGVGYDNFDPSARYDCFYVCPQQFHDVVVWFTERLAERGWPGGTDIADGTLPWHTWIRSKERLDLIDFTTSNWTQFPAPSTGWSMLRLDYSRKPARDFVSDDEYQAWFKESGDKGERWRHRGPGQ